MCICWSKAKGIAIAAGSLANELQLERGYGGSQAGQAPRAFKRPERERV